MKISVIIPVYNEEKTIEEIIERVRSLKIEKEIIVVNDGSKDNTFSILKKLGFKVNNLIIVNHSRNLGKGTAIRTGLRKVTGDIVIIQDADLETDPRDYYSLIRPIVENKTKVVYGSRFMKKPFKKKSLLRFLAVRILTITANILYGIHITDEATGYKVFKADILRSLNLKAHRFEFCPEVTAKLSKNGIKIFEVPISYFPRPVKDRKIDWFDGFQSLYTLFWYCIFK